MNILDRYIFSEFFKYFTGALLLLCGVGILSKIMERLSTLLAYTGPFMNVLLYIYLTIPYIITIVGPTALMFAISFTIANFSKKKELAVIMTSGRSFRRIISPVIVFAFIYSVFSFFLTEYVSYPWFLRSFDHLYDVIVQKNPSGKAFRSSTRSNYHAKINNYFLYIGRYDEKFNFVTSINVVEVSKSAPVSILESDYAIVIPNMWILLSGSETRFNPDHSFRDQKDFKMKTLNIPEGQNFLTTHSSTFEEKSVFQLEAEIKDRKTHGQNYRKHLVELYWHYSIPFVSLFIVMIAGIMGSQVKKGTMSLSISISTLITLVYYLLMYIGKSLAVNGVFHPIFGAWFANIAFTVVSIYLFTKYRI
ncbi:MAG: LptF/LptG family permease [Spirochaetia bacterium]|nr:LptF/LptG family permease [Spirochaetia bacterium]